MAPTRSPVKSKPAMETSPATRPERSLDEVVAAYETSLENQDLETQYDLLRRAQSDSNIAAGIEAIEAKRAREVPKFDIDYEQIAKRVKEQNAVSRALEWFVQTARRHDSAISGLTFVGCIITVLLLCALSIWPFLGNPSEAAMDLMLMLWLFLFSSLIIVFSTRLWRRGNAAPSVTSHRAGQFWSLVIGIGATAAAAVFCLVVLPLGWKQPALDLEVTKTGSFGVSGTDSFVLKLDNLDENYIIRARVVEGTGPLTISLLDGKGGVVVSSTSAQDAVTLCFVNASARYHTVQIHLVSKSHEPAVEWVAQVFRANKLTSLVDAED